MTSREDQLAALRFAKQGAEADVLRYAVEAGDLARTIERLQAERAAVLEERDYARSKAKTLERHIKRLQAQS